MVLASIPVLYERRLAARHVGAASATVMPFTTKMRRMAFTRVVLPTPGPPVITMTFDDSAFLTASLWLAARVTPSFRSTHGMAFSKSISGQAGWPVANAYSRSATTLSAFHR